MKIEDQIDKRSGLSFLLFGGGNDRPKLLQLGICYLLSRYLNRQKLDRELRIE